MSKPTILETIAASDPTAVSGSLRLLAQEGGGGIAYTYGGTPVSIGQVVRVSFDSSGALKADDGSTALALNPNTNTSGLNTDAIVTPANTVWVYEVRYPGARPVVRFLNVPDGAGPYNVADIFAVEPEDLGAMAGLESLRDTDVTTAADGDVLVYDTPPGLWRATAPTDLAAVTIGTGTADADRVLIETGGAIVRVPVNTVRGGPALVQGDSSGTRLRFLESFERLTNTANSTDNTVSQGSGLITRLLAPGTQTNSSAAELVPGSMQVATGASATGRCAAHWFHLTQLFGSTFNYRVAFRARLTAVPDGAQSYEAQLGFGNDWTTATRTNSFYFRALNGTATANWYACVNDGSTTTASDTTIALDASYHVFDIRYNAALSIFYFYIDGVQRQTVTRLPTTFTSTSPGFGIYKTLGGTTRGLHVDWIYVEIPVPSSMGLEFLA